MNIDLQHTPEGDIDLATGDLIYSDSKEQHQKDILLADKGHYKERPEIGVGTINFINDNNPENFLRSVRKELSKDGMKVRQVRIKQGKLTIDADYEDNNR